MASYPPKVNNRIKKRRCKISPKSTIMTQEQHQWRHYGVFTANAKHTTNPAPAPPFITLSRQIPDGMWIKLNGFCGMIDRRKAFSLISSRDHHQRSSPSQISDTPLAGLKPAQNLNSGFVEWSCAAVSC